MERNLTVEITLEDDFVEYIMDKVIDPDLFIYVSDTGPDPKRTDERFSKLGREIAETHIQEMDDSDLIGHLLDFYSPKPTPTGDVENLLDWMQKVDPTSEDYMPKLRAAFASLQQKASMHDTVDKIRIEQQDMLFRLCDMLDIEHVNKIEDTLHALQADRELAISEMHDAKDDRDLYRRLLRKVMPHIKFHMLERDDDGFFAARCPICDTDYGKDSDISQCTNPDCPAVIAREQLAKDGVKL